MDIAATISINSLFISSIYRRVPMLFLVLSSLLTAVSGLPTNDARYEHLLAPRDGDGGMLLAQFDFDPFSLTDMTIECKKEAESDPEFECTMQCKHLTRPSEERKHR